MKAKLFAKRGFTLVELMIVVAIIGVLAALAIYGVSRYMANAKTAEARTAVGQIVKDAKSAYSREKMGGALLTVGTSVQGSNAFCASANSVPSALTAVAKGKYQSDPTEWGGDQQTGWTCLRFSITDPQRYMYTYTASTDGFSAIGNGDLDGDGVPSTFSMTGALSGGEVIVSPTFTEVDPDE
jgi:type IV pilus assembly protein PilA